MPEHEPGAHDLLDGEEIELLPEDPVVPLLRLLEPVQVFLQVLLAKEGGAVDALQHLALFVSPPVGAGTGQQAEVTETAGPRDVGAPAEIDEGTIGVDGDGFVLTQFADAFELQRVVGEAPIGRVPIHLLPHEGVIGRHHRVHGLLDPLEILRRERAGHLEVVVEALVDGGSEADARLGKERADRGGQHMGRGVAQHRERLGIALGQEGDRGIGRKRPAEILDYSVDPDGEGGPGQSRPDRGREIVSGGVVRHLADAAIGEREPEGHSEPPSTAMATTGSAWVRWAK